MERQIAFGWERVQLQPGCEPGVSFVVDRVTSELLVEDGNYFYTVETFTRSTHAGDSDAVHNKVPAEQVAEMFRDIRPSGGRSRSVFEING